MSSDSSVSTSAGSRIRQFGLYRSIDARTEEFLRLSRKRQIKQGCACAAVSTAITVTVVIVILLIYEYAIAVESSLVQIKRKESRKYNKIVNVTNDTPVADRLDRSFYGFDQDYYERMPLLVNALQENNYVDPTFEISEHTKIFKAKQSTAKNNNSFKPSQFRRTSPRPFIFEYKSPTPLPFSRTFGSKSWIESYRNAQRLKNIQQVIKYLEKTINAKIGDMYTIPENKHIAFTGVYVEPNANLNKGYIQANTDLLSENPNQDDSFRVNYKSDPLFKYKPDNPGEINMLADNFLRFSPKIDNAQRSKIPMFRPIPIHKKSCFGRNCQNYGQYDAETNSNLSRSPESSAFSKAKSFSVMLNVYPLKTTSPSKIPDPIKLSSSDKIYITTSKPTIIFKRKANTSTRKRIISTKAPRVLKEDNLNLHNENYKSNSQDIRRDSSGSNMIVQINLYSPEKKQDRGIHSTHDNVTSTSTVQTSTYMNTEQNYFIPVTPYTTEIPITLSSTQVEDFHVGSSGVIPFESRTTSLPPSFPTNSYFDVTLTSTEGTWYTRPPDILKFSQEDAKMPDEYRKLREFDYSEDIYTQINRRNFKGGFDLEDIEASTLATKLRNSEHSTTMLAKDDVPTHEETTTQVSTTTSTQINGHYRSVHRNSKIVNSLLDPNSETNRKRRLNLFAKGFRRPDFSLSYTEIDRNKSKSINNYNS